MSKKTDQTLNKCEALIDRLHELRKALDTVNVASNRKPVAGLPAGWSHDPGTGALHHSTHGVISPGKQEDGSFKPVHHGGALKSPQSLKGVYANAVDAGKAMGEHARGLQGTETNSFNRPSASLPGPTKMGKPNTLKSEEDEMDKSNYGKFKGGSQYNSADNVKRKLGNTGDQVANQNVKSYTHRAMQHKEPSGAAGPVKRYSPEQIAAINEANKLKKNAENQPWASHSVPNADAELAKIQKSNPVSKAEDLMSNQLANMMAGKAMLGTPPPRQPTDQEMFGHLVPSEEAIQKAESAWGNKMNWLEEATKPICSRFSSPEEEQAYWDSIKVNGSSRDDFGF